MSTHEEADYRILIDRATNYILDHAAGAGLLLLRPEWDRGVRDLETAVHKVRLATNESEVELLVPHEWLSPDSEGHGRFRVEVEAAFAALRARS